MFDGSNWQVSSSIFAKLYNIHTLYKKVSKLFSSPRLNWKEYTYTDYFSTQSIGKSA
jgi:hypothetical protein